MSTADPTAGEDGGPAEPGWSTDEETALGLWISLARCYLTFSRAISGKVQEYGLTTPQFGVLEALYHLGPLSLGELADKLLVTGGNVTYVMDRLEQQKLVYRERSPNDRRVVQAKLTPEGRRLITDVFPGHAAFVAELSRHLELGEQGQAKEFLKRLGLGIQKHDLK